MLNQLTAILVQTVRSAVRSRLVLSVLGLLLFACALLPLSIRGDGTVVSEMRIALSYTMAAAIFLLSIATLWAAAGAVSHEVEGRQIRLLAVKPVNWHVVWLGKWLGVVVLDAAFLLIVAVILLCHVQRILQGSGVTNTDRETIRAEVLTARLQVNPAEARIDSAELHRRVASLTQSGLLPAEADEQELLRAVDRQMRAEQARVAPDHRRSWTFDIKAAGPLRPPLDLHYRMAPSAFNRGTPPGRWELQTAPGSPALTLTQTAGHHGDGTLRIPPEGLTASGQIIVTYVNPAQPEGRTVVFHRNDALVLLVGDSSFVLNLLRALLVVLCALATLAAIGVTAGAMFSFPVAAFAAFSVLVVVSATRFVAFSSSQPTGHTHSEDCRPCASAKGTGIGEAALRTIHMLTAPASSIQPVDKIAHGIRLRGRETARAVALLGLLYPAVLGLAGGWRMGKRELAAT